MSFLFKKVFNVLANNPQEVIIIILLIVLFSIFRYYEYRYKKAVNDYKELYIEYNTLKNNYYEQVKLNELLKKQLSALKELDKSNKQLKEEKNKLLRNVNKIVSPNKNKARISNEEQKKIIKVINNIFDVNNTATN